MTVDNSSLLISFALITYFIFCFFQGRNGTAKKLFVIDDHFRIGYIEPSLERCQPVTANCQLEVNQEFPHPYKQILDKDLKHQCYKIMVAIGYSEQAAKEIVKDFFKKNTVNSVEDFFVKINKS